MWNLQTEKYNSTQIKIIHSVQVLENSFCEDFARTPLTLMKEELFPPNLLATIAHSIKHKKAKNRHVTHQLKMVSALSISVTHLCPSMSAQSHDQLNHMLFWNEDLLSVELSLSVNLHAE